MKRLPINGTLSRVPEVIALRHRLRNVCTDEDCWLSGYEAHAGWCDECSCGLGHAAQECEEAKKAGWTP